jgi:hypothetical protein
LASTMDQVFVLDAAAGALMGILAAACISGSGIDPLNFYVILGLLIGCSVRIELERRAQNRQLIRPSVRLRMLTPATVHRATISEAVR